MSEVKIIWSVCVCVCVCVFVCGVMYIADTYAEL
jgi:hypothetical protein